MNKHAGVWWTLLAVLAIVAVLLKVASCGIAKELKMVKRSPARARGYTLIELLAVMTIVAIVMLIAIAGFNGMSKAGQLDREVSKLECAVSLGRQWAVTKNEPVLVVFVEPQSFAALNNGSNAVRCGWGILSARGRRWVKPFVDLEGAVLTSDTLWPTARNVVGLQDGGDSWLLCYTNIPLPWVEPGFSNRVVNLPGFAFKSDGMLHMEHGGVPGNSMSPKGVVLAPGAYVREGGWLTQRITGPARRVVRVNWTGAVRTERLAE